MSDQASNSMNYSPKSRRPIAEPFRKTAASAVRFCVARNIHPDLISYASIAASALAAVCFWQSGHHPWLLLIGPAFCYLRLWFNMLDGMVAIASGKASWRGEILNDLPDRISDVLIFVGVAHSGLCAVESGYWAAIMALLTAYVGMFGQAVGVQREFSGVMSKPWRMVALVVGSAVVFVQSIFGDISFMLAGMRLMDWTCLAIVAGCVQTIWVRLRRIFRALRS